MRLNNIFISMLFTLYSSTIPKLDNNKYENDIFSIPYMGLPTEVTVNTVNTIPNVKNERIKSKAIFFKSIFKKYVLKLTKTNTHKIIIIIFMENEESKKQIGDRKIQFFDSFMTYFIFYYLKNFFL